MNEGAIGAGVSSTPDAAVVSSAVDSPSTSQGSGVPDAGQVAGDVTAPVQDTNEPSLDDILKGLPSVDELRQQAEQKIPLAAGLASLRGHVEPLNTKVAELTQLDSVFRPVADRFDSPEQVQEVVGFYDGLIGWQKGADGQLEPATEKGIQLLSEKYPLHADYAAADLLRGESVDPETGQRMPRIDIALAGMAKDPQERAKVARMFGLVEPSSISPQWQPSPEELSIVNPDLQETYKKLPYEDREELKLASPEFINKTLADRKLMDELRQDREQSQQREQQRTQQREQYINQQADQAGDAYVQKLEVDALTTFHNSVVEQCNFLQPLDPANLPQGMTPEQAAVMNQQIAESNKAEAAQITLAVVGLINEETRPFVVPLLKQIGVIDDKSLEALDRAAQAFGDNARNYGHLSYRGQLQANGNGWKPGQDVVTLNNEAQRSLKQLIHHANQIKAKLMEKRSQFFGMKAQNHNQTLNSVASARPPVNGTTAPIATAGQLPAGKLTRAEIDQLFG
jgi:hypothetical protein